MYKTLSLTEMSSKYQLNLNIILKIQEIMGFGIELDMKNGPWIAGGSMAKCFTNTDLGDSDIDIFFPRKIFSIRPYILKLQSNGYKIVSENNVTTTLKKDNCKIQIINLNYSNVYELLNDFDFTIVKCAFDGRDFVFHTDFIKHNKNKELSFNFKIKTKNNTSARVIKYTQRGYSLSTKNALNLLILNRETTKDLYKQKKESVPNVSVSFY